MFKSACYHPYLITVSSSFSHATVLGPLKLWQCKSYIFSPKLEANEKYMDTTGKVHVLMYVFLMDCYVFSTSSLITIIFKHFQEKTVNGVALNDEQLLLTRVQEEQEKDPGAAIEVGE